MDTLSPGAEVFFTRLIMKADDFGCYYGNPKLLKSHLFPLKEYKDSEVLKWRNECQKSGVIKLYIADEKEYIHILNFGQRLRSMSSKFPLPHEGTTLTDDSNSRTIDSTPPPEVEVEVEVEGEGEGEGETKALRADVPEIFFQPEVQSVWVEWEKYRKEKRQKITPSTAKKQMQFLGARAAPEIIAIINQSITNGWTGLFELKKSNYESTAKHKPSTGDLAKAFAERVIQQNSGV
jgi:hypothetical protein